MVKTPNNSLRILFITTVGVMINSGGVAYTQTIRNAFESHSHVTTATLSELQRYKSRTLRWIIAIILSMFYRVPPNVLFHSGLLSQSALELFKQKWDLVVFDHLESAFAYDARCTKKIYISHNRESHLIPQKVPRAPIFFHNIFSAWVEHYEKKIVRSVNSIVAISGLEANWYKSLNKSVEVIYPVFINRTTRFPNSSGLLRVGFIGSCKWLPNRQALNVLINEILPKTNRNIELVIAGGGVDKNSVLSSLVKLGNRVSLSYLGYIDNVDEFWSVIDIFAAPIISGAGINVKVCEALAKGCPVVAFQHALRGLDEVSKKIIYNANSPEDFSRLLDSFEIKNFYFNPPHVYSPDYASERVGLILTQLFTEYSHVNRY